MPIVFQIHPSLRVVRVECEGTIGLDEIMAYEMAVVQDPEFDPGFAELLDLRRAKLDLSHEAVRQLVGYETSHQRYVGDRKVAFIAPKDVEFGLGRMYELMEDDSPMETMVFRDLGEACSWVGVAVADLEAG